MISSVCSMPQLDAGQMQEMREQMFSRLDQNSDGGIDLTEFQAMADHMAEVTGETRDVEAEFAELDTNSDGLLDQDELAAAKPPGPPPGPPPDMAEVAMDENTGYQTLLDILNESDESESFNLFA